MRGNAGEGVLSACSQAEDKPGFGRNLGRLFSNRNGGELRLAPSFYGYGFPLVGFYTRMFPVDVQIAIAACENGTAMC